MQRKRASNRRGASRQPSPSGNQDGTGYQPRSHGFSKEEGYQDGRSDGDEIGKRTDQRHVAALHSDLPPVIGKSHRTDSPEQHPKQCLGVDRRKGLPLSPEGCNKGGHCRAQAEVKRRSSLLLGDPPAPEQNTVAGPEKASQERQYQRNGRLRYPKQIRSPSSNDDP